MTEKVCLIFKSCYSITIVEHIFLLFLELNVEQKPLKCPFFSILFIQECLVFKYKWLLLKCYFHLYSFLVKVNCYVYISILEPDVQHFFRLMSLLHWFQTSSLKKNPKYLWKLNFASFFCLIIIYLQVIFK